MPNTTAVRTAQVGAAPFFAGKNKIINGAMQIAQRGTSFNFPTGGGGRWYSADRWFTEDYTWSAGSNLTVSNDSTVFPDGFSRSIKVATGATALTLGSGGNIYLNQNIEGFNIASLYKSTSVTLSFYVRSSVTGTYSILLTNNTWQTAAPTRGLIREYTVNAANTWERKTITINLADGTSAGTWNTNSSIGLSLQFNLGANADRVGNSYLNNWANWSAYQTQSTSSVQWTSNANATFYLTGVQLEEGSTATAFQTATGTIQGELAACERYFQREADSQKSIGAGSYYTTTEAWIPYFLKTTMRVAPTVTFDGTGTVTVYDAGSARTSTAVTTDAISPRVVEIKATTSSTTAGRGVFARIAGSGNFINFSAEL